MWDWADRDLWRSRQAGPVYSRAVIVTPPAELAVTLEEAKRHLKLLLESNEDDADVLLRLTAAIGYLDGTTGVLGRALVTQTWRQDLSMFAGPIRLPLSPAQSVTSVQYYDQAGAQQTLASSAYRFATDNRGPAIVLADGQSWPTTAVRPDAVSVTFVAGYGGAAAVPASLKAAILLILGSLYEHREQVQIASGVTELPWGVESLIEPFRLGRVA